ncbi:MAG: 23S rRNA (pseudouridine(1915)-N(3))-methyltransferase RlmH [Pseudomonadota bacterium]
MHIGVLCVAGRPSDWAADASENYIKRLPRAWQFSMERIAPAKRDSAGQRKDDEWQRLQRHLKANDIVILLDERGKSLASRQIATRINDWQREGCNLKFIVGGPDGVASDCRQRATQQWSVSPMTLPHELARLVLVEQLYRAHSIIEGHPYHRD